MTWNHTNRNLGNLPEGQSVPISFADSAAMDSFGRLRVSQPVSRFDAQLTYDLQDLIYEQLTNGAGAAIAHDDINRCAVLTLSGTPAGGYSYMQSYDRFFYLAGNSHQILGTFNFREHAPNVTKFIGYGDRQNNGIHFISDGSGFAWRILSNTDNGDQVVAQADWNMDTMDGNGPSGYRLDVSKTQIIVIDMQALYVGRVRVGFDIDGKILPCHEFLHSNMASFPYIQNATLPFVGGMECTDTATTTMLLICATVRSEGANLDNVGTGFSAEGTVTAGNGTRTHILSVRPKITYRGLTNRVNFVLESIEVFATGNNPVLWELCVGQAISGTTVYIDANTTYSAFEYNTAGTISGAPAIVIEKGYSAATAQAKIPTVRRLNNRYPITLNDAGAIRALGTLTLIVTAIGGTSDCRAALNWQELR